MAITLRLTEDEQAALRDRAEAEGISMQEAARRAVREYMVGLANTARSVDSHDAASALEQQVTREFEPMTLSLRAA